ncbi:MATE family efflux transporter [Candidatus Micrarchaeota archaeon CG10_big_fil_rev_8_21_14_0_10_45_29]|nr:MAG: MATE family efflux transporter [Candidatus Micrarchaeota archaeon CG10_big_fil_rev_8_21_14_0_10_45_29]
MKNSTSNLTEGPIGSRLLRMAVPMMLGMVAIMLFNVADTFFVGQIGAQELAAMGYSFPVIFVLNSIVFGIGIGAMSIISIAIGKGNHHQVQRITTHTLILALALTFALSAIGLATMHPIFTSLGASGNVLALVEQYVSIWYLGIFFLVIPMLGNSAIRATGDTKTPAYIMAFAAIVNIILDPAFIFGYGPIPAMGLQGAAIATIISWALTFFASLYVLKYRYDLLEIAIPKFDELISSWGKILQVGLPASATNLLFPLSMGILTAMVATYGDEAVAGFGVAGRIESLAIIGVIGMSTSIAPFVGQNFGAKKIERIKKGLSFSFKFGMVWGAAMFAILFLFAYPISSLFSSDPLIIFSSAAYLTIVPICYGISAMGAFVSQSLNAMRRPLEASAILLLRLAILAVPLAWLGSTLFGLEGLYAGIAVAHIVTGATAYFYSKRMLPAE